MTWYPPVIRNAQVEEFDSIAEVFEECDNLEAEVGLLKGKLRLAVWALGLYSDEKGFNAASMAIKEIGLIDE